MGWLRRVPQCRRQGALVNVTVDLDPKEISPGPCYLVWSGPGLVTDTSKAGDPSAMCCMPEAAFKRGAVIKLELLPAYPTDRVVLEWTHIPVLGEALFVARMQDGRPALVPLARAEARRCAPDVRRPSRNTGRREPSLAQLAG
jgi:hypothetical protein